VTVLDAVPVERITGRAREVRFTRTVLAAIAGLLFGIGWLVAKASGVAWLVLVWCAVAVSEGWQQARKGQMAYGPARSD
jgi:hypothetical protein